MLSVKGVFAKGTACPLDPPEGCEGQAVIVTFLEDASTASYLEREDAGWSALTSLIRECAMDTGIEELAHQHDHYLYDRPKRD